MEKITTTEIEVKLASYFNYRQNIIVPNISFGLNLHEVDLLILRASGYGVEVEIKISKSDLKADLKKHHKHKSNKIREFYFAIPNYLENYIEYIPLHAGILILTKTEYGIAIKQLRSPEINKTAVKFTDKEKLKLAHLGTMRIWNLKRKIKNKPKYITISRNN